MKNKAYMFISILVLLSFLASACSSPSAPLQVTNEPTMTSVMPTTQSVTGNDSLNQNPAASADLPVIELQQVAGQYLFTEGPAVDMNGNVYFSDINAGRIYKWSTDGSVTVFIQGLNKPNGLAFDGNGMLIVCEGGNGRLISIDSQGQITVLVDQYKGVRFNEPNDLWIDPQGGVYFTDPAYQSSVVQDGEHVYYLFPDRSQVIRVISDMVRPNGIVGTADGKNLYVTDHGAGQTFSYDINADGTLASKKLFVSIGSDGMELDAAGNLYLTTPNKIQVFDTVGNFLQDIPTRENPTNVAFGGADGKTLFITARTAVYISASRESTTSSTFTLTSPDIGSDGRLPVEYTCDGASSTLPLAWSGAPSETKSFAVIMHHVAPDNAIHWYWVVYDIPATLTSLAKNIDLTNIGILGTNSVNDRNEYAPPCSKGPGDKEYIYTVYALSTQPQISVLASQVTRAVLLDAIKDITLASSELHVVYARP
jgi:gluconolactonase